MGEHGFASARRALQKHIVVSSCRDLQSALRGLLARDVREVHLVFRIAGSRWYRSRRYPDTSVEVFNGFTQTRERDRIASEGCRLGSVLGGEQRASDPVISRVKDPKHDPSYRAECSVERELSEAEAIYIGLQLTARSKDREGDGKVEARALFASLGGREIHNDAT